MMQWLTPEIVGGSLISMIIGALGWMTRQRIKTFYSRRIAKSKLLDKHIEEHSETLIDHEKRITVQEKKQDYNEDVHKELKQDVRDIRTDKSSRR